MAYRVEGEKMPGIGWGRFNGPPGFKFFTITLPWKNGRYWKRLIWFSTTGWCIHEW